MMNKCVVLDDTLLRLWSSTLDNELGSRKASLAASRLELRHSRIHKTDTKTHPTTHRLKTLHTQNILEFEQQTQNSHTEKILDRKRTNHRLCSRRSHRRSSLLKTQRLTAAGSVRTTVFARAACLTQACHLQCEWVTHASCVDEWACECSERLASDSEVLDRPEQAM